MLVSPDAVVADHSMFISDRFTLYTNFCLNAQMEKSFFCGAERVLAVPAILCPAREAVGYDVPGCL